MIKSHSNLFCNVNFSTKQKAAAASVAVMAAAAAKAA
jgi:hypothetical protein